MDKYDVCIIGCGPGGFAAAMRAVDFGKKVCLVESGTIGGAGIFWGALTSKTMWELAKDYAIASKVDRGYRVSGLVVDFNAVRKTVIAAAKEKQYQIQSQIESFNPSKGKNSSVTLIRGHGQFKSHDELEIKIPNEDTVIVTADNFIIATGSRPRPFPNIPFDGGRIISSDGVFINKTFPARMIIIGAGIIGSEFATIFNYFDQTKIYLLDHQDRIIPFEDPDLSECISKNLEEKNVTILHKAILREIKKFPEHLEVVIDFEDGHSKALEVDMVMISIGRIPNTSGLGLEKLGLKLPESGLLKVDENCRLDTNIFAIGDVTGTSALVNIAEMEGRYVIERLYGVPAHPLNYNNKSTIMFFRPEVAAVGLNEMNCRSRRIPYKVAKMSLALVNRAIAMRNTNGFVKILVTKDAPHKILGMRAVGPRASDLIITIAIAMDNDMEIGEILKTTHPHPSTSEALQSCLTLLDGTSIYKPEVFPEYMEIRTWEPEDPAGNSQAAYLT